MITGSVWRIVGLALALGLVSVVGCAVQGGGPRPQVATRPTGDRYAPLPPSARVKVYLRGEPEESYREIGTVTATCPEKHWVAGREESGRPVCLEGLRQGARKLGAQAVVDVSVEPYRPAKQPERPWLVMEGAAIRLDP